jgi:plasmid stabilization system protein ParE
MEKQVIITKRFRTNVVRVYQYILKEFSAKTACTFLAKVKERVDLIVKHPEIGKPSSNKENIRSLILTPHNLIYRLRRDKSEILCLFDMRVNPKKKPY